MALTITTHHADYEDIHRMKHLLRKTKEHVNELCDLIEETEVKMQEHPDVKVGSLVI